MSFANREASRQKGEPITLYFFRYGDTPASHFAYTDGEEAVVHAFDDPASPITFQPIPISRGAITSSGSLDRAALQIMMPDDEGMPMLFRYHPPSQVVTGIVFQGHVDDDDFKVVWAGRVLGCQLGGQNTADFTCEPISTSLKRNGLRRRYQYGCPHVLYGPQCKADQEAASIYATVGGVSGALVSLGGGWSAQPTKYVGGLATWANSSGGRTETRTIVRLADTNTLVLSGIALGLSPGMPIKLAFGCDHIWNSDCTNLHDNVHNFGGDPFIPTKNPIGIVNNFY